MIPEPVLWSVDGSSAAEPAPQLSQMAAEREFENVLVSDPEMLKLGLSWSGGKRRPPEDGWTSSHESESRRFTLAIPSIRLRGSVLRPHGPFAHCRTGRVVRGGSNPHRRKLGTA